MDNEKILVKKVTGTSVEAAEINKVALFKLCLGDNAYIGVELNSKILIMGILITIISIGIRTG